MFPTLIRRLAEGSKPPSPIRNAPYRLKKVWPPDFSKLSPAEQFRFEKKYKRRVKLAAARPRWNKFIKLTQLFSVTFVVVYGLLFMDSKNEHQPFDGVRKRFWEIFSPSQRFDPRKELSNPSTLPK